MRSRTAIWLIVIVFIGFLVVRPILIRMSLGMSVFPSLPTWGGFGIPLPRGYSLAQTMPEYTILVDLSNSDVMNNRSDGTVTDLSITGYRVYDDLLVGRVTEYRGREFVGPPPSSSYFIFRFSTGTLEQGLSRKKWQVRLRSLGIRSIPKLHRPTGMDDLRGYNRP